MLDKSERTVKSEKIGIRENISWNYSNSVLVHVLLFDVVKVRYQYERMMERKMKTGKMTYTHSLWLLKIKKSANHVTNKEKPSYLLSFRLSDLLITVMICVVHLEDTGQRPISIAVKHNADDLRPPGRRSIYICLYR